MPMPMSRPTPEVAITRIVAAPLLGESPKGGWSHEIRPEDSVHTLIAVHTSAGITGFGSVFTNGGLVQAGLRVLEPLFLGENALEPERVTETLHQNTFWMGRGGTLTHVISGIDIALWDILGKVLGQPVGRLLGGIHRTRVRPYCSLLMEEPDRMGEVILPFREAAGPDADLLVDAGGSDAWWQPSLKWAIGAAHMLADYRAGWFEEALRPDALEDFIELRRQSPVPIAGGEVLTRRQAFTPFLVRGAFDIVQPDVTKVGGISEQRRIAWMADDFGVRYVGHGWNTALGVAADLQLAAALPHVDYVEFIGGSPYVDGLLAEPFRLDADGCLEIPLRPGLGVELDPEKVARYSPDAAALFAR